MTTFFFFFEINCPLCEQHVWMGWDGLGTNIKPKTWVKSKKHKILLSTKIQ